MNELERQFQQAVWEAVEICKKHRYTPTYFIRMLEEHGAVATCRRLLQSPEPQEGLFTLWELGLLDISIEALALRPRFQPLFTQEELTAARSRLAQLGYQPPEDGE